MMVCPGNLKLKKAIKTFDLKESEDPNQIWKKTNLLCLINKTSVILHLSPNNLEREIPFDKRPTTGGSLSGDQRAH